MDTISRKLARFALGLRYEDLSAEVLHKAKQMLLDPWAVLLEAT